MKLSTEEQRASIEALGLKFTAEEMVVVEFLNICAPSLDPDNYRAVEDACAALAAARPQISRDILDRARQVVFKAKGWPLS